MGRGLGQIAVACCNVYIKTCVSSKNGMLRLIIFILAPFTIISSLSCSKDSDNSSSAILYGTWIKGANVGDTIWFYKEAGKDIMKYDASFNPLLPLTTTTEYKFENDQLLTKGYLGMGTDFHAIQGFAWKQRGSEFELQGSEIYVFMSSTLTKFTFHKAR
jgi:hypothetical protein